MHACLPPAETCFIVNNIPHPFPFLVSIPVVHVSLTFMRHIHARSWGSLILVQLANSVGLYKSGDSTCPNRINSVPHGSMHAVSATVEEICFASSVALQGQQSAAAWVGSSWYLVVYICS